MSTYWVVMSGGQGEIEERKRVKFVSTGDKMLRLSLGIVLESMSYIFGYQAGIREDVGVGGRQRRRERIERRKRVKGEI